MRLIKQNSRDCFNYPIPCISDIFKKAKNFKIDSSAGGAYSVLLDLPAEHLLGFWRKVIAGKCLRSITHMNLFHYENLHYVTKIWFPQPLRKFGLHGWLQSHILWGLQGYIKNFKAARRMKMVGTALLQDNTKEKKKRVRKMPKCEHLYLNIMKLLTLFLINYQNLTFTLKNHVKKSR